jgi:hypothetical protein
MDWYELRRPGWGSRFNVELQRSIESIEQGFNGFARPHD